MDFKTIFLEHVILYLLENLLGFSVKSNGCGCLSAVQDYGRRARLVSGFVDRLEKENTTE